MTIDGKEIETDKMYKIATNVFTAQGGDNYEILKKAYADGRVSEPGFVDWENFRRSYEIHRYNQNRS